MRRLLLLLLVAFVTVPGSARGDDLLGENARTERAIEDRIALLLAHTLMREQGALAADIADLEADDRARREADRPPTGLTDDAHYLAAGLATTRDARRAALHDVLDTDPDPVVRRLAEHRLETDDAAIADRLLADDRYNRRAHLVNEAIRPLGILNGTALLAAANPFFMAGSALDSVVTTSINLWHYNRLSTPEREALARYRASLARTPATRDAQDIARAIHRLGEKREEALCDEAVSVGRQALRAGDLDRAGFYLGCADRWEACAAEVAEPLADLRKARARRAAEEDGGRRPVDDPALPRSDAEARDYEALLLATAIGEPSGMVAAADRFRSAHRSSPHLDAATYVVAAAQHLAGHPDEGREVLAELADDGDSSAARHAVAVLGSRDYDRLGALDDAEEQRRHGILRYVLLGRGLDGRTALYSATRLASGGLQAMQSLGFVNALGVLTRAWGAWRRDPVSNEEIIDRGEELLAREPRSPEGPEVHRRLADAYERSGAYARALMHYREVEDPDPEHVAELEEKLARHLLDVAESDGGDRTLLARIARELPETEAGEEAQRRLAERAPERETVLARDLLEANPDLLGPQALDLDPLLLDGRSDNGEIADAGVVLADGTLRLTLRDPEDGGERTETRPLPPADYERARAAAAEVLYARLLTAKPEQPDEGRYERYVPFYLQGAVGESGVSLTPGIKMRRYRSSEPELYR